MIHLFHKWTVWGGPYKSYFASTLNPTKRNGWFQTKRCRKCGKVKVTQVIPR